MTETPEDSGSPDQTEGGRTHRDERDIDAALAEPAEDLRAGLSALLAPPDGMTERATSELKERLLEKRTLSVAFDLLAVGLRTGRLILSPDPPTDDDEDA